MKVIDLMVPVDMTLKKIYGFAGASTNRNIYLFGGFNVDEYSDEAEDFYRFHTPHVNRSKLLPLSSVLYEIDIENETFMSLDAPKEFATANATLHVTDNDMVGKAERLLMLGGTSKQIAIYSKSKFEFEKCDLQEEFGGCQLNFMTPTTVTHTCTTCGKQIHEDCDMFKHMKRIGIYKCPKCKGFGIITIRPKITGRRGRT